MSPAPHGVRCITLLAAIGIASFAHAAEKRKQGQPPAPARPQEQLEIGEDLHCPPPPPPPSTTSPTCGNGKAEDVFELIPAPCIPGRCCASGWVRSAGSEDCDGADLRGESCETLGFLGGRLKCTASCKIDKSACTYVSSPGAKIDELPDGPQCTSGHFPALARRGALLGIASPGSTTVVFRGYQLGDALLRTQNGVLTLGGGYDQSALAEYYSPHGPRTTTGTVMMAAVGDGFIAAVQRFGDDTSTAIVRVLKDGTIQGPLAKVPGPPLFLVGGPRGALLGYESTSVEVQVLGMDGAPVGKPAAPFSGKRAYYGQLDASAAPTAEGWMVAAGSRGQPLPIEVATVSKTGEVSAVTGVSKAGTAVLVTQGAPALVAYLQSDGLFVADVRTGKSAHKLQSDRAFQLLAGESGADGAHLWIESKVAQTGTGMVTRLDLSPDGKVTRQDVVAVPLTRPCAALLQDGALHLWLGDENNRTHPRLFRGR